MNFHHRISTLDGVCSLHHKQYSAVFNGHVSTHALILHIRLNDRSMIQLKFIEHARCFENPLACFICIEKSLLQYCVHDISLKLPHNTQSQGKVTQTPPFLNSL